MAVALGSNGHSGLFTQGDTQGERDKRKDHAGHLSH